MRNIILALLLLFSTALYAGEETSSFTLKNTEGREIHVQDIKEGLRFVEHKNAVFLLMFGHNCPPCKEEMPNFIELTDKHKDDLTIVAVEVQGYKTKELKEYKAKNGINYNLISGAENSDFIRHIVQRAGWKGAIPLLIAIDKNGAVKHMQAGIVKKEFLEELVKSLNK